MNGPVDRLTLSVEAKDANTLNRMVQQLNETFVNQGVTLNNHEQQLLSFQNTINSLLTRIVALETQIPNAST